MDLTHLSDAELIHRCQTEDDHSAFSSLVDRYRNDIYRIIYHFLKNSEDTLDAMQEVFIKAYSSLPRLHDKAKLKPWLIKIAVNQAVDYYRKRATQYPVLDLDNEDGLKSEPVSSTWKTNPRKLFEIKEINQQISNAVAQLSKQQRVVFILRYFEEMQISEIAESLDCSEGTVKSNLFHALNKMRKELYKLQKGEPNYARMSSVPNPVSGIPVWGIIAEQIAEI
jgi:RNA polymerase sigma-70 factor (ECF subfamily)